jgi:hypothetical protein
VAVWGGVPSEECLALLDASSIAAPVIESPFRGAPEFDAEGTFDSGFNEAFLD